MQAAVRQLNAREFSSPGMCTLTAVRERGEGERHDAVTSHIDGNESDLLTPLIVHRRTCRTS